MKKDLSKSVKKPKFKLGPEVCHYCGKSYHPMPVYTSAKLVFGKPAQIFVCHSVQGIDVFGKPTWKEQFECRKRAIAEGYEHRPDLGSMN